MSFWGYGLSPHQYEEMRKQDLEYLAARAVQEAAINTSLQSFTAGDAKKGAGLFKVSNTPAARRAAETLTFCRHDAPNATPPLNPRATRLVPTYTVSSDAKLVQ
jgi:hypothetical protein